MYPTMEEHYRVINECVAKISSARNSKVLSKERYDKIVSQLSENSSCDSNAKFRWWVKDKGYKLLNFPEIGLTDVLCIPAKNQVQSRYEGIPRSVIQEVCRTCSVCLLSVKQTNNAELKPILSSGFLTRAQIDLIDMRHKPDGEFSYIAHFMDHWSKYHVIWPLKRKTADEVANGLNEKVFPYLGLPRILHSDNGREFVNKVIRELVKDWGGDDVIFVNGRPRHSQSQGLVEQGNATIERHIANKRATLGLTGDYPWASWLPKIQYNMNTEVAGGTKKTPYEVVFGQPPRTTILPGATVENNVINEEDLNFELNPTPEFETEPIAELEVQKPEIIPTRLSAERSEREHQISETATDNGDATLFTKIDENLPRIEKPTPKLRRKKLIFSNVVRESKVESDKPMSETTVQTPELTDASAVMAAAEEVPETTEIVESNRPLLETTEQTPELTDAIISATDQLPAESEYVDSAKTMSEVTVSDDNSTTGVNDHIDELFLQDPHSKHFIVRQEADANYRANAERMKAKYSKRKRVTNIQFIEGDFVTIRVPKIDRSSTDHPRLIAKVIECKGTSGEMYRLQCRHGFIEGWYRTSELMPYEQQYDIPMRENVISLREASRLENPNKVERKKCRCQGPCSKNCFCVKNNLKCSSHCHPSKTCRNVDCKPFVNASLEDRKIVSDGNELTDKHMLAVQQLLKKRFPINHGLRDTLTIPATRTPEETPYIQILHVDNNHWVTIAANRSTGPVEVYDSLNATELSAQTLQQIKRYHGSSCTINLMNVQQQKGSKDCGLFAIATATSLCFGDDPTMILYNQDELRQHLLECLAAEDISPFPHGATKLKRRRRWRSTLSC